MATSARVTVQEVVGSTVPVRPTDVHWWIRVDGPAGVVRHAVGAIVDLVGEEPMKVAVLKDGVQLHYVTGERRFESSLRAIQGYLSGEYAPNKTWATHKTDKDKRPNNSEPHVIIMWAEPTRRLEGQPSGEHVAAIQVSAEAETEQEAIALLRPLNDAMRNCRLRRTMWAIPAVYASRRKAVRVSTFGRVVDANLEDCLHALAEAAPNAEAIKLPPDAVGADWNVDRHAKGKTDAVWLRMQDRKRAEQEYAKRGGGSGVVEIDETFGS